MKVAEISLVFDREEFWKYKIEENYFDDYEHKNFINDHQMHFCTIVEKENISEKCYVVFAFEETNKINLMRVKSKTVLKNYYYSYLEDKMKKINKTLKEIRG